MIKFLKCLDIININESYPNIVKINFIHKYLFDRVDFLQQLSHQVAEQHNLWPYFYHYLLLFG